MKHIKIIAGVTAAAVVVGGSLAYADGHSGHAQHKNSTDQAKVVKVKNGQTTSSNGNSSTDSSSGSDSDSSKKIELVKQAIIGHGFAITPKTYNGLEVDKAMDQPGAPQNLVHDYVQMLYFTDDHTVRTTGLGMYVGETTEQYTITDKTLNVHAEGIGSFDYTIPYHIENGHVVFDNWSQSWDGHNTFTYQFTPDNDAKSLIDSKPIQDGHDTSNTNSDNNNNSTNSNSNDSDDNNSSSTNSNNSDNNNSNSDDNNDNNNSDSGDSNDSNTDQNTDDNNSNSDDNGASNSDSSQSSSSSDDDTNNN